jgi:Kef-type K+ transport system membrane component KefB
LINSPAIQQVQEASQSRRLVGGYLLILLAGFVGFFAIRSYGEQRFAGHVSTVAAVTDEAATGTAAGVAAAPVTKRPAGHSAIFHVLLALVVILITAHTLGWLFSLVGQPRVIGEMVAGFLLGPTLLGRIAPGAVEWLFPVSIHPQLGVLAQVGLLLFIFLVGLELNLDAFRSNVMSTLTISHSSIALPMVSGALLSLWLYPVFAPEGVSFTNFSLFIGVAMSITAFPLLARILVDSKMDRSKLGMLAIACAAIDDATAWWLLAIVVGVAQAQFSMTQNLLKLAAFGSYLVILGVVIRPAILRWLERMKGKDASREATGLLLLGLLASALLTEWMGISGIFGAFLLGAVVPHNNRLSESFRHKLEDVVHLLLLPVFFAHTGVTSKINLTASNWWYCAAILFTATLGKWGGTMLAARWVGFDWRTSGTLGLLMNTRGLIELIVLTIGRDMGILSPDLFGLMVLMAIGTTMATSPLLPLMAPPNSRNRASGAVAGTS